MKKWKNVCRTLVVSGALLGVVGTNIVSASNHSDKNFSFKYPAGGVGEKHTDPERKDNATAVYFHPQVVENGRQLYAWAIDGQNGEDMSDGHKYFLESGDTAFMTNYIHEEGRMYGGVAANLRGYAAMPMKAYGKWSPDSIR
ncbi:hypothetical protein ACFVXR_30190 [Bacillus thuringiensis]|nr:hypothetical protein AT261_05455 [Bacillus cereus]